MNINIFWRIYLWRKKKSPPCERFHFGLNFDRPKSTCWRFNSEIDFEETPEFMVPSLENGEVCKGSFLENETCTIV